MSDLSASVAIFSAALAEKVGVIVATSAWRADQQTLYRHLRLAGLQDKLSILPRGELFLWVVHKDLMKGKKFDAEKARQKYNAPPSDPLRGPGGEGPSDVAPTHHLGGDADGPRQVD